MSVLFVSALCWIRAAQQLLRSTDQPNLSSLRCFSEIVRPVRTVSIEFCGLNDVRRFNVRRSTSRLGELGGFHIGDAGSFFF